MSIIFQFKNFKDRQKNQNEYVWEQPEGKSMSPVVRILLSLLITVLFGAIYFYIELPAINIHAIEFYWFLFLLCVVYTVCRILLGRIKAGGARGYFSYIKDTMKLPLIVIAVLVLIVVLGSASGFAIFRSSAYAKLLNTEEGNFSAEVAEISLDQIPMLDSDSANNLANRKLGDLSDLVSQFSVSENSSQINYKGKPVRVTYLNYDGFFKWWKNRSKGLPAYMIIDMVTQDVDVVRLEEGIRFSPSELFNRNLKRQLRFQYPTFIFDNVNFEIDEEGTPYWIASVTVKKVGLFNGDDIKGAVLLNAVTGESQYYDVENVPTWVDRVYSADLLVEQYNLHGAYVNGFLNSYFGQTDCTVTTSGYNYIAMDDDVWMYTGVTSITSDRGNIGFILVNQRTKEARYYSCAGAEEFSAMSSAEGAVQQYNYDATFPLLLNIADEPTYFMALKDTAGLVKMYAMVNVQQYQIVATGSTVQACQENYRSLLIEKGILTEEEADNSSLLEAVSSAEASGVIREIRSAAMGGDTYYYFLLEGDPHYYTINARDCQLAVILNVGDKVTIGYSGALETITAASQIQKN